MGKNSSHIVFAEWLSSGVMVRFANEECVFFPSDFLFAHREEQPALPEPEIEEEAGD